ncbi:hypothetical protein PG987_008910 [Apiospora arundinis]
MSRSNAKDRRNSIEAQSTPHPRQRPMPSLNDEQRDRISESIASEVRSILAKFQAVTTRNVGLETMNVELLQGIETANLATARVQEELSTTETHINSLQPSRVHLTASDAKLEFEGILQAIDHWIDEFITPVFTDDNMSRAALETAARFPGSRCLITRTLEDPFVRLTAQLPETDEDIVTASLLHCLTHKVFHQGLWYISSDIVSVFADLEKVMIQDKQPLYTVQSWRAQTYDAWVKTPQYQTKCESFTRQLATQMMNGVAMFFGQHNIDAGYLSLLKNVISPAVSLKEKMMASKEAFQVLFDTGSPLSDDEGSDQKLIDFEWESCFDITDNHRPFKPTRMDDYSEQGVSRHLFQLMPISPGLIMRKIQRDNKLGAPEVVVKQKRLVAWKDDPYQAAAEQNEKSPTFYWHLSQMIRT